MEMIAVDVDSEEKRQKELLEVFEELRKSDPFREIEDVMAWQREMREDVVLPWDETKSIGSE